MKLVACAICIYLRADIGTIAMAQMGVTQSHTHTTTPPDFFPCMLPPSILQSNVSSNGKAGTWAGLVCCCLGLVREPRGSPPALLHRSARYLGLALPCLRACDSRYGWWYRGEFVAEVGLLLSQWAWTAPFGQARLEQWGPSNGAVRLFLLGKNPAERRPPLLLRIYAW